MTPVPGRPRQAYVKVRDVVKDFGAGSLAVNHVSLDIAQGEIFALLGSSGCGKTTLLRMLAGFEVPTAGTLLLDGQELAGLPPYLRPINMMFQSYALFPHLTVWDNVAFGLKREGMPKKEVAERVEAMLRLVQLQQLRQAQAAPALRRPAAAGGAGPEPGQAPQAHAARRAAGRAGQEAARGDADRAGQHHPRGRASPA